MTSTMLPPTGTTSRELFRAHLSALAAEEKRLIELYARLAAEAPEPLRGLALAMLDEGSVHHEMVEQLLDSWMGPVPRLPAGQAGTEAFSAARHFLEEERVELSRLGDWVDAIEPHHEAMYFELLLRLLELDAAKHVAVLDFVRRATDSVTPA